MVKLTKRLQNQLSLIFVCLVLVLALITKNVTADTTVTIGETTYTVEVADNRAERQQGLGNRIELGAEEGMLFVFDAEWFYSFWMKDMNFNLDIIWIDEEFRIVDIERNISPDSYPDLFVSIFPAQYVLEVSGGEMQRIGAQLGQSVVFSGL